MTHDELLDKINYELECAEFEDICGDGGHPPTHRALRAVVELHKPEPTPFPDHLTLDDDCAMCQMNWPCPTIQAIEKEL